VKQRRVMAVDFKAGKPTRWQAYDLMSFDVGDASKRRMTAEGFMVVPANISRTGIQEYTARELGLEGTNRTIRLYRPPEEVFKPESYRTFERQTLTNEHPQNTDGVTAENYRSVTAGDVHDVAPVGDDVHLGANLYYKDANTIEMVVTYGKNQLSCGYSFVLDMTPGVTPDGEAFDGVMRDIVGNHVATVWQARGGPGLRVADKKPNQEKRIMRTVTIDGTNVNFEDDNQGAMVELALKRAADGVKAAAEARDASAAEATAAKAALAAGTAAAEAAKTAHDAKVRELEVKVVTDAQIDALVEAKAAAVAGAKAIVGDSFDGKGKAVSAIHVEALEHIAKDSAAYPGVMAVLGGKKPSEAAPEIAKLAFDAAVAVRAAVGAAGTQRTGANDAAARAFAPGASGAAGAAPAGARVIDYNARGARPKDKDGQASA